MFACDKSIKNSRLETFESGKRILYASWNDKIRSRQNDMIANSLLHMAHANIALEAFNGSENVRCAQTENGKQRIVATVAIKSIDQIKVNANTEKTIALNLAIVRITLLNARKQQNSDDWLSNALFDKPKTFAAILTVGY